MPPKARQALPATAESASESRSTNCGTTVLDLTPTVPKARTAWNADPRQLAALGAFRQEFHVDVVDFVHQRHQAQTRQISTVLSLSLIILLRFPERMVQQDAVVRPAHLAEGEDRLQTHLRPLGPQERANKAR